MSDISIPGVNSKYGTQNIIDSLVKVERNKLVKMEADKKALQGTKLVWQETNKYMQNVRDSAKALYGFNTPFGSKLGTSGDETVLTVSATRGASNGSYAVKISSAAASDRFLSDPLPLDKAIAQGDYVFLVGDKEISFTFKGGKVQNFVDAINIKKPDLLKASVIKNSSETQLLQLEGIPVGQKNTVGFQKMALSTLQEVGMLVSAEGAKKVLQTEASTLLPGATNTWKQDLPLAINPGTELRMTVQVGPPISQAVASPKRLFTLPDAPEVNFEGITISGGPMKGELPPLQAGSPAMEIKSMKGLSVVTEKGIVALPELPDSTTPTTYSYVFNGAATLTSLQFSNGNSARSISISELTLVEPAVKTGMVPKHALSTAADATLEFEGIKVNRDSNTVSDLIPGVTLNLKNASEKAVIVKIEPDKKAIKDGIISFMANYNRLITDILVLTTIRDSNPASSPIITEASYLTDDEKKKAEANLGLFQGDIALNQVKSGLQRILMNPYATDGSEFTLLSQVGISTNAAGNGDKVNASKLRGYLELDEPRLDESIAKDLEGVRKLFGNSTDGSLIVNTGAAFSVDELLKPSTQLGGFNSMHISTIDGDIKSKDKQIASYNDYLTRYQQDLKNKYGQMEASLNSLNKNSQSLNFLGNTTTGQ